MAPVALSPGGATQFNGSQSLVTTTAHYHTSLPHHTPTPRLPVCIGAGSLIAVPLQVETCGKPCDNPVVRHNTSTQHKQRHISAPLAMDSSRSLLYRTHVA